MNIFVVELDPIAAAKCLIDRHITKMTLESSQMLATAIHLSGGKATYKPTHINHPCNKWVRQSKSNYLWLFEHLEALSDEYTGRYYKVHKCSNYFDEFLKGLDYIPDGPLTPFAQAMPDEFKDEDVVKAYRQFYIHDKKDFATWKRNKPEWWPYE